MSVDSLHLGQRAAVGTDTALQEVIDGLRGIPRTLSPVWLYDERGCALFEQICGVPEYYPTRTETAIMQAHVTEMCAAVGPEVTLIEYGSGNSSKTRLLLDHLTRPRAYVPIDIAASSLALAAHALRRRYPQLEVLPLCADFTRELQLPLPATVGRRLIYFPGSTIGNYEQAEAQGLLALMREQAGEDGLALIGFDLRKQPALLQRAYDDAGGVTAEFNLNVLRHLNHRFGANFDLGQFRHRARWVEALSRIEMHLVSTVDQSVRLGSTLLRLSRGDFIRTECSHKYSPEALAAMAAATGWRLRRGWSDERGWFAVQLLELA